MKLKKKMGGFVQTAELVLLSTVLVTGLTVGVVNIRDAVNAELEDVAESIGSLDQSYSFTGIEVDSGSTTYFVAGSAWTDSADTSAAGGDDQLSTYALEAAAAETGT